MSSCRCNEQCGHDSAPEARHCDEFHRIMRSRENKKRPAAEKLVGIDVHRELWVPCGETYKIDFVLELADGTERGIEIKNGLETEAWSMKWRRFTGCPYIEMAMEIIRGNPGRT